MSKRIILILSALLFLTSPLRCASAQETVYSSLFDEGSLAFYSHRYLDSERKLKAALKECENFSKGDTRYKECLRLLANVLDHEKKFDESSACYQKLVLLDEATEKQIPIQVADLINLAKSMKNLEKNEESLNVYNRALSLLNQSNEHSAQAPMRIYILIDMAQVHAALGQNDDAEKELKDALKAAEADQSLSSQKADVLSALAAYYSKRARYEEAETCLNQARIAIESLEPYGGTHSADNLLDRARLERARGDYQNSASHLAEAIAMRKKLLGQDDPDVCDAVIELASLYEETNSYKEALQSREQIRSTIEKSYGEESPRSARFFRDLANDYILCSQYGRAETLLKQSLAIDEKTYGKEGTQVAFDLNALGMLYLWQGRYAEAEPYYKRALSNAENKLGPAHPEVATCLNNLAWLYDNEGKPDLARTFLERGLSIREKAFGVSHPAVARNLHNLAKLAEEQKKWAEAKDLLQRAWKIQKEALGSEHPETMNTISDLADVSMKAGDLALAEDLYRRLLAFDESMQGSNSADSASDLDKLARVLIDEKQFDEAKRLIEQSNSIKAKLPGNPTSQTGEHGIKIDAIKSSTLSSKPVADKWALVVGISNFKDPAINLQFAAKDAIDFKNYLTSEANFREDHVRLLTDQNATRGNIIANLGEKWLGRMDGKDDLVVIYLSSHGTSAREEASSANFIVPYETNFSNAVLTGIPMQWFTAAIKTIIPCNRIVVVMDVCHGGALRAGSMIAGAKGSSSANGSASESQGGKMLIRQAWTGSDKPRTGCGTLVIASSESDQISWESKKYSNGVFTRRLIEALRSAGTGTTLFNAFKLTRSQVEQEVLRDRAQIQTPVLIADSWSGGDVVLGVKPAAPRPAASLPAASRVSGVQAKGKSRARLSR